MAQVAQFCNPPVMLDIGCGNGELLEVIAKRPLGYEYIGIDIGDNLNEAKGRAKLAGMENTQFLKADCTLLPLRSNSSQLVFCASILEHVPDVPSALSELERVLQIDGKLVVGAPSENRVYHISRTIAGLQKPSDHYHTGAYLETLLADKFPYVKSARLPFSFLPRSLSLYSVLVCGRS